jgi:hypothetical protein
MTTPGLLFLLFLMGSATAETLMCLKILEAMHQLSPAKRRAARIAVPTIAVAVLLNVFLILVLLSSYFANGEADGSGGYRPASGSTNPSTKGTGH